MITKAQRTHVLHRIDQAEYGLSMLKNTITGRRLNARALAEAAGYMKQVRDILENAEDTLYHAMEKKTKETR